MVRAGYTQGYGQSQERSSPVRRNRREDRDLSVTLKWAGDREHPMFLPLTTDRTQIQ